MLALFIAVSCALALVVWAEWRSQRIPTTKSVPPVAPDHAIAATAAPMTPPAAPAPPPATKDQDDLILARLAQMLAEPVLVPPTPVPAAPVAPQAPAPAPVATTVAEDLPRISGFRPGDVIELEIEGPLPRPEDLRFEQVGRDARMILEGLPALIFEGVPARALRPSHIRFRSPQAA
ncbi:hypothetical protein C8J30_10949 [Rhodobacter viridis]|uniref:Uncharacterized protein n=1 Tax=Rhodobacter viridis TaxID=1054202 RepID=A0A318TYC0_9RHOB|nr:hypothetical protein [Rhodobacter viridis]PYF09303.1 hypothetical protein C8J30_10949 [Rhodobacter viridis]